MKYIKNYKIFEKKIITSLDFTSRKKGDLPELPKTLQQLYCPSHNLTYLPELPSSLVYLHCNANYITELPKLPPKLQALFCSHNRLSLLPELPNTIKRLECGNNKLTSLPELPTTLDYLNCSNNKLTELPELPKSLTYLDCDNNDWKEPIKKEYAIKFKLRFDYTFDQLELFCSEDFQREFLTKKPERFEDLSYWGVEVEPVIRKEFEYIFDGGDMGFFDLKTNENNKLFEEKTDKVKYLDLIYDFCIKHSEKIGRNDYFLDLKDTPMYWGKMKYNIINLTISYQNADMDTPYLTYQYIGLKTYLCEKPICEFSKDFLELLWNSIKEIYPELIEGDSMGFFDLKTT